MCIAINQSIEIGNGHAVIYYNLPSFNLYAHSSFNNRLFTFNALLTIKKSILILWKYMSLAKEGVADLRECIYTYSDSLIELI